ncbi:hypothetical protein B0T16DRAFT_412328 [Cercophora newfieldiana]|uniref:Uncharacterized protein n=1 Tax=Cercophora newfieldiana TaxID=92897 RepID=A0AA39Y5V5_9PEZI|nr:hypothetical protein B0T16DRAFT_412328 [Cercophora newfieldiana]
MIWDFAIQPLDPSTPSVQFFTIFNTHIEAEARALEPHTVRYSLRGHGTSQQERRSLPWATSR